MTENDSEFYLRIDDPLRTVYEVDRKQQEVRLAGSLIGGGPSWPLKDDGAIFATERFQRVRKKRDEGEVISFVPWEPDSPSNPFHPPA